MWCEETSFFAEVTSPGRLPARHVVASPLHLNKLLSIAAQPKTRSTGITVQVCGLRNTMAEGHRTRSRRWRLVIAIVAQCRDVEHCRLAISKAPPNLPKRTYGEGMLFSVLEPGVIPTHGSIIRWHIYGARNIYKQPRKEANRTRETSQSSILRSAPIAGHVFGAG